MTKEPPTNDGQLIELFLSAIEGKPLHAARDETGVSANTISRFRRGDWKNLFASTRRSLVDYLVAKGMLSEEGSEGQGAADVERSAEKLIAAFTHPAVVEALHPPSRADTVQAIMAYATARRFPPSEMAKLVAFTAKYLSSPVTTESRDAAAVRDRTPGASDD